MHYSYQVGNNILRNKSIKSILRIYVAIRGRLIILFDILVLIVNSGAQTTSLYSHDKQKLLSDLLGRSDPDVHPDGNGHGQIDVRVDYTPIYLDIVRM